MPNEIVIIHGWSDTSETFNNLASLIANRLGIKPTIVNLADYISKDVDITFTDLIIAMDKAWTDKGISRNKRSVDVIVHSTGALILRAWLTGFFKTEQILLDLKLE